MPKKPVTIGEMTFTSKQEAKTHFFGILNRIPKGRALTGIDLEQVTALLLCHPRAYEKVGSGISSILVADDSYQHRCFHIIRSDNSVENFSVGKCIDGDHSAFHKFSQACRKTVAEELHTLKVSYFKEHADKSGCVLCPITKQKVSFSEAHLDHREPFAFSAIVHFFLQANNIDLNAVQYITHSKYGNEFVDAQLAERFRLWHKQNAKLRIIKAEANLSKAHLARISSTKADQFLTL